MAGTIWLWNQGGAAPTNVTAVVLTVTPTQPAARVDHDLTAVVLTVTPSLPAASLAIDTSHTATVLTVTPSLPAARIDHSITAVAYRPETVYEQHGTHNDSHYEIHGSIKAAQTFLSDTAHTITKVRLGIHIEGSPPNALTVGIHATTGGEPSGAALTSGTLAVAGVGTGEGLEYDIALTPYALAANVTYAIVLSTSAGDINNDWHWNFDSTSADYANGQKLTNPSGLAWTPQPTQDFLFYEYGYSVALPQARVDIAATAVVISATPTFPTARLDHDLTALVLSVTPSFPQASIRHHTIIRPNADVTLGNWTDELDGTTNIYLSIDEISANDADYVKSGTTPSADKYRFHLSDPTDPVCSGGHSITYRYKKESAGNTMSLVVRLIENVTTIATWTETDISDTLTTTTRFLTPTEADAITDYSDLRVELEATQA